MRIMCKNMTHAMRANRLLHDGGIRSRVEKINDHPTIKGCIYSIVFADLDRTEALRIMKEGNVLLHRGENQYYEDVKG